MIHENLVPGLRRCLLVKHDSWKKKKTSAEFPSRQRDRRKKKDVLRERVYDYQHTYMNRRLFTSSLPKTPYSKSTNYDQRRLFYHKSSHSNSRTVRFHLTASCSLLNTTKLPQPH
eukprot:scaffold6355_cov119-Cylindrotheca_fusiformis.AAC.5